MKLTSTFLIFMISSVYAGPVVFARTWPSSPGWPFKLGGGGGGGDDDDDQSSDSYPSYNNNVKLQPTSSSMAGAFAGDATFYTPDADACGTYSTEADLVAALNAPQFQSSDNHSCGRRAVVSRNGISVTVKIVDECPECKHGDLDLSPAAFNRLADPDDGRVHVTWKWVE
jgi:hypothetical protein